MALYRFFFAPVLLAIAVLAGRVERSQTPPPAAPAARASEPVPSAPAAKDRVRPVRSTSAAPRAAR